MWRLEFKDALVIGEREENGGTLLQNLEEEKSRVSFRTELRVLKF